MPISRSQMPRQMYGLGSFVKSIGKGIKKIVKSPIGKAAILGFGANALMPGGLSSLFSGSSLPGMFGKATNFIKGLSGKQLLGAGSLGLAALASAPEEVQMESSTDVGALRKYLTSYYQNLGYSADQIAENVARDTSEYTSGQGGYANGGRIGYAGGTEKIVQPSASMMVDTTTSNPIPNDAPQKEISEVAKIMLGPGRSGIGEPEDGTMKGYQFFRTQYLPKKVKEISENFGIEESDVLRLIREEMMQYIDTPKSLEKPKMAYGGRMNYGNGMDPLPYITENGLRSLDIENLTDAQKQYLKNMKEIQDRQQESLMKKIKKLKEGMPENERNMKPVPIRKIGPEGISGMAYGGRIKRAYGSDDLVEQASGIEGLDININPKGVKELDLRETGGFIPPVGVKEKADDIPAMLSNNEFVFTADAVRAAGGGSVNKGAQIMYDTMKKLENGGTV